MKRKTAQNNVKSEWLHNEKSGKIVNEIVISIGTQQWISDWKYTKQDQNKKVRLKLLWRQSPISEKMMTCSLGGQWCEKLISTRIAHFSRNRFVQNDIKTNFYELRQFSKYF